MRTCKDCPALLPRDRKNRRCRRCWSDYMRRYRRARGVRPQARARTYNSVHTRVSRERGPAIRQSCARCGEPAHEWSYDHKDPNEVDGTWQGRKVRFSLDPTHYVALCRSCHRKLDAASSGDSRMPPQLVLFDTDRCPRRFRLTSGRGVQCIRGSGQHESHMWVTAGWPVDQAMRQTLDDVDPNRS